MTSSFCASCGRQVASSARFCPGCGAPNDAGSQTQEVAASGYGAQGSLHPAFQRVEDAYRHLRSQYQSGAINGEQFTQAVEAQAIQHEGAYWMIGVDSGQWYRSDGGSWQAAQPPMVGGFGHAGGYQSGGYQPAGGYAAQAGGYATEPPARPKSRRNLFIGIAVAAAAALFFGRFYIVNAVQSATRSAADYASSPARADDLLGKLAATPLPASLTSTWTPSMAPELSDTPYNTGEEGTLIVFLGRSAGEDADLSISTFKNETDARAAYDEAIQLNLPPEEMAEMQNMIFQPAGMTATCYHIGSRVTNCRVLTGRTIVFASFMEGEPQESALAFMQAMIDHVAALDA